MNNSTAKRKIIEFLLDYFWEIDCSNCKYMHATKEDWGKEGYSDSPCRSCHYRNIKWALEKSSAEYIADKILGSVNCT